MSNIERTSLLHSIITDSNYNNEVFSHLVSYAKKMKNLKIFGVLSYHFFMNVKTI